MAVSIQFLWKNIFKKQENLEKNCNVIVKILRFFGKKDSIFPKIHVKKSKLKGQTQNPRKKVYVSKDLPSSTLPSGVKKARTNSLLLFLASRANWLEKNESTKLHIGLLLITFP